MRATSAGQGRVSSVLWGVEPVVAAGCAANALPCPPSPARRGAGWPLALAFGLLVASLAPHPLAAQDGTAAQEEGARNDIVLEGPDPDKPRDPAKGAVTNLPIPRFVSLKGQEGNARRGPGLTHRIDWVFTREDMPLKITAEYENWRRVEDVDGAGGWVHYSLLSGVRTVLVTQDMAEAHDEPDQQSEVMFQNEMGVIGKLLECVPDWCRISVEGEKGWLRKSALWGVFPDEIYP